jgi:hypothetical protein
MIGFIGSSLQLQSIITAHILNSWTTSLTNLGLVSAPRIHECSAFYNCHAAGIEVTMSDSSSDVTGMTLFSHLLPGNDSFAAIHCNGN